MKENTGAVHAQVPVDVATYLLNEKRAEFHSIESRLKVNVVLIPNVHLETPNYTVTRLKHEELNQADVPPPSYEMVVMPEKTETSLPSAQTEPAAPRQEAAVKGITPSQPAPIMEPRPVAALTPAARPGPSIIGKIFGWFKRSQPEVTEAAKPLPLRERGERGERGGQRRGRPNPPRRDGQQQRERPAHLQRNDRSEQREPRGRGGAPRPPRDPQREQQRHEEPQPRLPRPEQAAIEARVNAQPPREQALRPDGEGRGRRRRRGGRDRHDARENQTAAAESTQQPAQAAEVQDDVSYVQHKAPPAFPAAVAPAAAAADATLPEGPQFLSEKVVEIQPPAAVIPAAPAALEPTALPSDLKLIETDPEKKRIAASRVEPPQLPRPPRVRPSLTAVGNEPLVQIETRK